MKQMLLHISLLAAAAPWISAMDTPPLVEPLELWVYEDSFDEFVEKVGTEGFFHLKNNAGEELQVSAETVVKIGADKCEAFAFKVNENGKDTILQISFNYNDVTVQMRNPVRATTVNNWDSIIHYRNIDNMKKSCTLLNALIEATKEQKKLNESGEVHK